jgi:hypothetical protein
MEITDLKINLSNDIFGDVIVHTILMRSLNLYKCHEFKNYYRQIVTTGLVVILIEWYLIYE